jgi:hypothetical protein
MANHVFHDISHSFTIDSNFMYPKLALNVRSFVIQPAQENYIIFFMNEKFKIYESHEPKKLPFYVVNPIKCAVCLSTPQTIFHEPQPTNQLFPKAEIRLCSNRKNHNCNLYSRFGLESSGITAGKLLRFDLGLQDKCHKCS